MTIINFGILQMGLTTLTVYGIIRYAGEGNSQSITMGLAIAISSTAIVLRMITDSAEIDTLHGRICIGTLLFQDICVVPLMLLIPLLGQTETYSLSALLIALLKSIGAVTGIFLFSRLMVPRILNFIAHTGSKEHLTLFVILIILGTGWVSQLLGLTLAMGAFIAGFILSESEYHHQIILDIIPIKDYFGSIFFIAMGMLLKVQLFFDSMLYFLGLAAGVILLKMISAFLAGILTRNPIRISLVAGVRLAQAGEFSLLLADLALIHEIFPESSYQTFLIVSILTMLAAPLLIHWSSVISIRMFSQLGSIPSKNAPSKESLTGHVIIAGCGLVGRNLCRVLRETKIPFLVLELDGERIKQALEENIKAQYGDSTRREILLHADIQQARMMVFTIPDPVAAEQGIRLARKLNPNLYIIARTRFSSQVEIMSQAGADQVIPEEFETSIEIFSRVLREYHISNNVIEQQIELIRLEGYSMFRGFSLNLETLQKFSTYLEASLIESFHVLENSWSSRRTLGEIEIQSQTGASLIAVIRNNQLQSNPNISFNFEPGDILILFGRHAQLDESIKLLKSGPESENPEIPS